MFIEQDGCQQKHKQNMKVELTTKSTGETYQTLCHLMDTGKKVYYARFGDGDILIMQGKSQQNHDFHPKLQEEMMESFELEDPLYLKGLTLNYPLENGMDRGFFGLYHNNDAMHDFLVGKFGINRDVVYESQWFTQYYSLYKSDNSEEKRKEIIKTDVMMVPQEDIEKLVGKVDYYVRTPHKNSYWEIDDWWPKVLENIDKVELVLPASGMSTRVINKRLWKLGKEVHCIDLGSIVDAAGKPRRTRRWLRIRGHAMNKIMLPEYQEKGLAYRIWYTYKEFRFLLSKWHFKIKHRY